MIFKELPLSGAYLIEMETLRDKRGAFMRQFCMKELAEHNLDFNIRQCSVSENIYINTLRGMHYQKNPYSEIKIVSCNKGAIYDVIVDLRKDSSTYLKWYGVDLTENNYKMLYIPKNFAHGFLTLESNSSVYYQISEYYRPEYSSGLRWNDSKIGICWPDHGELIIKDRDAAYELL